MTEQNFYQYLIVGGGMVADSAARGIREVDPDGTIGIVAEEQTPPVARPALSKKLWTDSSFSFDDVWLNTEDDTGAVRHAGDRAVAVDRDARTVRTQSGMVLGYDRLLLATGGAPATLGLPEDDPLIFFRSLDDYERLRRYSGDQRHVVVVGGSFIGSELAAALVENDTAVTLVFPDDVLFGGVFPPDLARYFQSRYEDAGVTVMPGVSVESGEVQGNGHVVLTLSDGTSLECDAVAVGAGVSPNNEIASVAGLSVDDGVLVDELLRTSDPRIFAAGDVASYPDAILGRRRIEHVDNATTMGRQAGRNLAGAEEPYTHTPYFYSVAFGDRYEAVGTLDASLEVVEMWDGDRGVVYYVDGRDVVGVLLWNINGRRDDAREAIDNADGSDHAALRSRIPTEDGDAEQDDKN
ncbi:NAD(P)/FAD-dependent oxidoreductase [Corynebacterium glyciniphilum]|uniref:Putative pyridine nucleotide-disulfide oxidoreductase n=1 Tax=Corynebacterium glyciniphilum AJ 3170 TaxID=1404245 RepID=X5DIG7_9CORY|nr:FAD-dependent oxidoreductase [Corynebacterium glyciniphilum]AHW62833.1 Putative pyridine nucleotide-disulfide oxidoreductase [Corynebacterium glyciniphilum AJ 3170]